MFESRCLCYNNNFLVKLKAYKSKNKRKKYDTVSTINKLSSNLYSSIYILQVLWHKWDTNRELHTKYLGDWAQVGLHAIYFVN